MPQNKIDYSKNLIYKIVCKDISVKDIYVGRTTDFKTRKGQHHSKCNNPNAKMYNAKVYVTIRENGGWDNWDMIELEKYPCKDSNEAKARERYWYETLTAKLNTNYPDRNKQEYTESNKEKFSELKRQYYLSHYESTRESRNLYSKNYTKLNKQKISEKGKIKVLCECGANVRIYGLSRHMKTLKHCEFIGL